MKKALSFLSLVVGNIMIASAQVSITGGSITIGVGATQGAVNGGPLLQLLALVQTIVGRLVPLAIGLAVLAFFWYLIKFVWYGKEDAETKKVSLAGMGYSLLAIFVMVSVWGLIGLLGSMVGVGQGGSVPVPAVPVPTQ